MREHPRASAGFTLIEVLIAVVVLSVALAGMIPVLLHTVRANAFANMTSRAATYSQDKLEELRAVEFSAIEPGNDTPEGLFSRSWTVDDTCEICIPGIVVGIEVTTQWTDPRIGTTHRARYYTVQADVK
ncbi:MAG: prepilin-type N-terminal cleavage/methylation domain-containing protein [Deferrisomatales bacterium]|nr:prepilin-type N-terminal cleavage/methylation domain-containing protein [Deferrisomatales bacterium]